MHIRIIWRGSQGGSAVPIPSPIARATRILPLSQRITGWRAEAARRRAVVSEDILTVLQRGGSTATKAKAVLRPIIVAAGFCALAAGDAIAGSPELTARQYRSVHEKQILEEFTALLSMPNVATNVPDVDRNAAYIVSALQRRGFSTDLLRASDDSPAAVLGELRSPGASRTLVFYAHYDGQPANQEGWRSRPFDPVVRAGANAATSRDVDWRRAVRIDPEWRIYARGASDDKAPIQALLTALDSLKAAGRKPSVNVKVFYEGEEEQGSAHLGAILARYAQRLRGDIFVLSDGPRHPSGSVQLFFGARGSAALEMTVYGPARPLHSGHYGNWAPNPASMLANLLASMRDDQGRILIPGFYDDVRALSESEVRAIRALPDVETSLRGELALGRTEGSEPLALALTKPALNVRGIRVGSVGEEASNTISTEARASVDFRLVPDETPENVRARVEEFLKKKRWYVVHTEPSVVERAAHERVVRLDWALHYPAYRTSLDTADARWFIAAIERSSGQRPLLDPMLGGSVPMKLFADALGMQVIGLPIANHDNNQHGANENLRLGNLWDAIEIYAGLLTTE